MILKKVKKKKEKLKTGQIFETISDVGSVFMAILYILYVAILLIFDFGTRWLNFGMLGITFIYIIFFIIKITTINKMLITKRVQKKTKLIIKYSKWSMKIINATFIIMLIATAQQHDTGNIFMMIGVFIMVFSFIISVVLDVIMFILRRKIREFRKGWDNLSRKDKNARLSNLLEELLHSLDYLTGADISDKFHGGAISTVGGQSIQTQDQQDSQQEQTQ